MITRRLIFVVLALVFAAPAQAAEPTVAVLYFDNNTGQAQYDPLGKGLADMLITDLTRVGGVHVVEREKLQALVDELKLQKTEYFDSAQASELGRGLGADFALTGAVYVVEKAMRIDARVVAVESGRVVAAEKVLGPQDEFFDLVRQLTELFVKNLDDALYLSARKALRDSESAGPANLAAAASYSRALDLADQGDLSAASEQLSRAVKQDPDFKLAAARQMEILKRLEQTTSDIKNAADRIEAKTDRLTASMERIADGFESLADQGGVIPNPDSAEEYYHNARIHELNGDYGNARRAYLKYFAFDLNFVDPYLRFITFLKVQEGPAGARETFAYIKRPLKSMAADFAQALLWSGDKRTEALIAFTEKHPDFAPAYYELSKDFSEPRKGRQSLSDKQKEKKYLKRFMELDEQGRLVRYFLDQRMVAEMRQDARDRLTKLSIMADQAMENPVKVTWMQTNSGWMGTVNIVEPTLDILVKKEGQADFKSLGHQAYVNPQTGRPLPVMTIPMPYTGQPAKLWIKYVDIQQNLRGPFEAVLNPKSAALAGTKQILNLTRNSWISFKRSGGRLIAYFSHLMSYRGALEAVHYGVNAEQPDQEYEFPAFDGPGVAGVTSDTPIMLELPADARFMSVRLTYKDGEASEVQTFQVPAR